MEGAYSFSVNVPVENLSNNQEPQKSSPSSSNQETNVDKGTNGQKDLPIQEQETSASSISWLIYTVAAVIVVILILLIVRRKNRS
ncbi:hypothetical protein D3C78_1727510 [compost metagenome]